MDKAISGSARPPKTAVARAFVIYWIAALCVIAAVLIKFLVLEKITTDFTALSYLLFSVMIAVILLGHFIYVACSRSKL
ncbi:MAG: hypothetical protein K2L51_06760, partial [Clostridiales bacterium]|nr:hypothetical protein [Clostridiales bacterium]